MADEPQVVTPDGWQPFPAPAQSTPRRLSVSIPVDEAGNPEWDKVKDKVRQRFKDLLNNPATQAAFMQAGEPGQPALSDEQARMMALMALGTVFQLQAVASGLVYKLTREEALSIFKPDFRSYADFDAAIGRILQKHGPEWLAKFADEVYVSFAILMVSFACWSSASNLAAQKRDKAKAKPQDKTNKEVAPSLETIPAQIGAA